LEELSECGGELVAGGGGEGVFGGGSFVGGLVAVGVVGVAGGAEEECAVAVEAGRDAGAAVAAVGGSGG
jgi:hypothetical protein